jgi:hypothetical protein
MANTNYQNVGYSLTQGPLTTLSALPIVAKRAPTIADFNYQIGQLWVQPKTSAGAALNSAWILTSVINNSANWLSIQAGGGSGAGSFTTLTSTGATNLATAGASNVTIATTGTGSVTIGNVTGNTSVVGTLTTSGAITATAGNITATAGNVVLSTAASFVQLPGPVNISSGAGVPGALALHVGDIYINTTAATAATRVYCASAVGTWVNFTMSA